MIDLVVFLGNPGKEYQHTRHNLGWMILTELEQLLGSFSWNKKADVAFAQILVGSRTLRVCRPEGFINNSGKGVRALLDFFKIDIQSVLVVHDDLETKFGHVRLKMGGGASGHNGLRSIDQHCGGQQYWRLKVGIGRPAKGDVANWVLSRFSKDEEAVLPLVLAKSTELITKFGNCNAQNLLSTAQTLSESIAFQGA
jgi:PTH1 family peptidyl-tRNA hydrolase